MEFYRSDAESILYQIKRQEKQIKLKRRWLLGIYVSTNEGHKIKKAKFLKNRLLPESLLREDDMFYESVRTYVECAFGACHTERDFFQDDMRFELVDIPNIKWLMSSCLDNLTTKGLYLLAMIVSGGSVKFEKTRCKLKKIIKGSLSTVLGSRSHNHHQLEIYKQIFQLLTNPQHFRDNCDPLSASRSQSYSAAVKKVLENLQHLPYQTLLAMYKKLKGVEARIPQLQTIRQKWSHKNLSKQVNKFSEEMLSQLDGGDELPENLLKAMAVADLSLKLTTGCHNIFSKQFYEFSPEVKSLQNEIMKAISIVKKVASIPVLRNWQLLFNPKAVISNRSLRNAFITLLTDFLFECSDIDTIPKPLLEIVDVINRSSSYTSYVLFQKGDSEEEVNCILSVSAQTKQILLDLLPDHEFDEDYSDAYMEQLEESDIGDSDDEEDESQFPEDIHFINGRFDSMDSNYIAESIGESIPLNLHKSTHMTEGNGLLCPLTPSGRFNGDSEKLQHKYSDTENFVDISNDISSAKSLESKDFNTSHKMETDQYQETQQFGTCLASRNYNSSASMPGRRLDENVFKRYDSSEYKDEIDPKNVASDLSDEETEPIPTTHNICKNQYLTVQDLCDETSMLAYNLVGHLLEEFSKIEGLCLNGNQSSYLRGDNNQIEDVKAKGHPLSGTDARSSAIVRVVEELIPSFPHRLSHSIGTANQGMFGAMLRMTQKNVSKNIELGLAALCGEKGTAYDRIGLNAGMVDHLLGVDGAEDISVVLDRAREAIDSGYALKRLLNYIKISISH